MGFFSRLTTSQKVAAVSILCVLIWLSVGYFIHKEPTSGILESPVTSQNKIFPVETEISKGLDKEIVITVDGITKPDRILQIVSKTSGTIDNIYVKKGTIVEKNARLADMDMRTSLIELKEAKSSLKSNELQYQIQEQLFTKGYSTKVSLARSKVELEEAKVKEEKTRLTLENETIQAPFKGIIDNQFIEKGTYVTEKTPLFVLLDLDPILISASLPKDLIPQVHESNPVRITFSSGEISYGKISFKSVLINENNHMAQIEISVPNPQYTIHAGQNVNIEILLGRKFVHVIPAKSLSLDSDERLLIKHLDSSNRVLETPVTVASTDDNDLWLEGLPPTIQYIVTGQDFVKEGDQVTLSTSKTTSSP